MKKLLFAVLAFLAIGTASAQIKVVDSSKPIYVIYGPSAGVSLKYTYIGETREYYLQLTTTNQFDDPIYIFLGDRDNARESLETMLNKLWQLDKMYELEDSVSRPFKLMCANTLGAKGFYVTTSEHAGHSYIRLSQIGKMLEKL